MQQDDDITSTPDDEPSEADDACENTVDADEVDGEGDDVKAGFDMDTRVGKFSRQQLAALAPEEQLAKWNETLFPLEVDLITELDATNLFFVHAESVIFDLILAKEVAFEEDTQFLCFTYAIEQLLSRIRSSGGHFRLIFFDASKKLFSAAFGESVWAFREALLLHCRSSGIDYSVFSHWYSQEWNDHVSEWRPSFFLLTNQTVELEDDEPDEEDEEELDDKKPKLRGFFLALMLRCLSCKTHVALLRGLQHRGNRVMAFTLEPDCYDGFIDYNVQASLIALFSEEEEDEDEHDSEDSGTLIASLKDFAERAGDKVEAEAVLRSFLSLRFVRSTLKRTTGQNAQTQELMQVMLKSLLLQEMLLRQIPMDKRAYSTIGAADWELFAENIAAALEKYFSFCAQDLRKLVKEAAPEGLSLHTCDLFDGRLYRHIFHFVVEMGLHGKDGKVGAQLCGFKEWAKAELDFLWKEAGSTEDFFPISVTALKGLPGIQPPPLPEKVAPRQAPELVDVTSDFLEAVVKATEKINHVKLVEAEDRLDSCLWNSYNWQPTATLDAVKEQEFMERNAQVKLEEQVKRKGKLTAKDMDFLKQFWLKYRQLALKSLHAYSKSLTGSDKLHLPIIMKEEASKDKDTKDKKGEKAEEKAEKDTKEKVSKKHQEILEKRAKEDEEKVKEHDKKQMKQFDPSIDALEKTLNLENLEKDVLDLLLGLDRITDSFVGLPRVTSAFHTSEAQLKVVLKVIKNIRTALKMMQLDKLPPAAQPQARRMVRYLLCIVQEAFNSYGQKKDLDGKGVKLLQEALISIGFPQTAEHIYNVWKAAQVKAAEAATDGTPGAEDKGGKDEKKKAKEDKKKDEKDKKGKDDKKDDKKEDKKGKKDSQGEPAVADPEGLEAELAQYRVKKEVEMCWSGVGADEFAFQLQYMGPYMTRTVGNAKDEKNRVNFKPDKWQRELLDIVDDKRSALIVAPTASGKTFIGYYVMDKVLRADNDGVAVYVAPSKALVNQVSAEIYARFGSKTYPMHSKNELLGVFLKEFNTAGGVNETGKWRNCQVLVTIPHILEMLLLSPTNQDWVKRLRWVVFDEVHCIGGEDGLQWEHTMQLIPCPFLALSATVAEPHHFYAWLNRVNEVKKHSKVEMVVHTERWNDLHKYIYVGGELKPLHPFCCLVEQAVRLHGLSSDLTLTPEEMAHLFQECSKIVGNVASWDRLAPRKYFGGRVGFLTKLDAREYEMELKATFLELVRDGILTSTGFSQLNFALQQTCTQQSIQAAAFTPPPRIPEASAQSEAIETPDVLEFSKLSKASSYLQPATLYKLCKDLDNRQALPAIVFNFNRKELDRMLTKLIQELKDRQKFKYYGTEDAAFRSKKIMERRIAEYHKKKTEYEQAVKMKESKNQEAKASRKTAEDGERGAIKDEANNISEDVGEEPVEPLDLADEIDMEFSFHSPKALGVWAEEIEEMLKELKKKNRAPDHFIDGLRRGVGMHHEACTKYYKQAVEVLFRRGYLKVVLATGTLALGINMPCRSTVFCGDSLELNGLMFRQMSGRAGRRGFDLLGQVVFLDMGFLKISSLVASDLSKLAGEFYISPTTLLRALHQWELVTLAEESDRQLPRSREDIARCLAPMFSLPFFRSDTADLETQVAYQTRFSVDFLYKENLLSSSGYTRGLANLATHLFEAEPANIVLARLLGKGLLHEFLLQEKRKERKGDRRTHLTVRLVGLLGWLFYRRRLPATLPQVGGRPQRKKHLPSLFSPKLPPLPKRIANEVMDYNKAAFEHVQELAWAVASTRKIGEADLVLPLSKKDFRVGWDPRGEAFDSQSSELASRLKQQMVRYRARSPFSAISGVGDCFRSTSDLVNSSRNVLHLDMNSFPALAHPMLAEDLARDGLEPSNSWILDFMLHGKIKYLWEDNGLNPTKAFKLISDFSDVVKKATVAIRAFSPPDDIVYTTFDRLAKETNTYLHEASN